MRKSGSNGARLDKHDIEISKLKQEVERTKNDYKNHLKTHIVEDLQAKRFPGSDKPLYTYDDIASKHDIDRNVVQRVAQEENLTRRSLKKIK